MGTAPRGRSGRIPHDGADAGRQYGARSANRRPVGAGEGYWAAGTRDEHRPSNARRESRHENRRESRPVGSERSPFPCDDASRYTRDAYGSGARRTAARRRAAARRRRTPGAVPLAIAVVCVVALVGGIAFGASRLLSPADSPETQQSGAAVAPVASDAAAPTGAPTDAGDIVIGVNGSPDTYVLKGESYIEGGAHAASATSGVLTPNIVVSGEVDTSTPGDYRVTYRVEDSAGHVAEAVRTVHVVESMDTMKSGVPVLMYHYVYTAADVPANLNNNYILDTQLAEQLDYVKGNGFYYPSFAEVQAFLKGTHSLPAKSVVFTFDDGEEGFLKYGVPLFEERGIPVTSFMITSDAADAARKVVEYASPVLEFESHSSTMHQPGGTVGHGGRISAMTKDEIVADLQQSSGIVGSAQAFAYPFGDVTPDGQAAVAEAGMLCAFTTQNDWDYVGDDCTALARVRISSEYSLDSFVYLVSEL